MIVSFLDLLGFSQLLRNKYDVAIQCLNHFNDIIYTKKVDEKHDSQNGSLEPSDEFFIISSLLKIQYMISISDSLIMGGKNEDCSYFVKQISYFLGQCYIRSTESMYSAYLKKESGNDFENEQMTKPDDSFPIFFRGGIDIGTENNFFLENSISNQELKVTSLNVTGRTYLNAVILEAKSPLKGPRLFCTKRVVESLDEETKKIVRKCGQCEGIGEFYEIVWTVISCEVLQKSSDSDENIRRAINKTLLPAAIYLYLCNEKNPDKIRKHYEEFVKLICMGILKYASLHESEKYDKFLREIQEKIQNTGIEIDGTIIEDFIK